MADERLIVRHWLKQGLRPALTAFLSQFSVVTLFVCTVAKNVLAQLLVTWR